MRAEVGTVLALGLRKSDCGPFVARMLSARDGLMGVSIRR